MANHLPRWPFRVIPWATVPFEDPSTGRIFVNLTEIAQRWRTTVASVLRYHVGVGRLMTTRAGRAHYVSVDDLARYEEKLKEAARRRYEEQRDRLSQPLPSGRAGLEESRDNKGPNVLERSGTAGPP